MYSCGMMRAPRVRAIGSPHVPNCVTLQHKSIGANIFRVPSHLRGTQALRAVNSEINPLVQSVKPSKTMALTDLATSMREAGNDVISLSVGQPDFATPHQVCEAAKAAIDAGQTKYTPNTGTLALRTAICNKLKAENQIEYSPDQIVVTNGAKQAIWQVIFACVSPGDEVIVPAPYWVSYPEMVRLAGGSPKVLDTTAESNFCISPQQLQDAITPKSRLLILCSPSNPSGAVYSADTLRELADVVREHPRLMVVSDEIYEHIIYPPSKHMSFAALPEMWERTFTVNGVSKAFAMTGWRVGYLAAPTQYAAAAALIQSQSTSGACSVSQAAAVAALGLGQAGGEPVQQMVREFLKRRDFIVERLEKLEGVSLLVPQGAFYVLPDFSHYFGEGVSADGFGEIPDVETLCRYLLMVGNVALVPGDAFGVDNCIRISYAASLDTLEEAMNRVEKSLHAIKRVK